jgi:hypothetical protein
MCVKRFIILGGSSAILYPQQSGGNGSILFDDPCLKSLIFEACTLQRVELLGSYPSSDSTSNPPT